MYVFKCKKQDEVQKVLNRFHAKVKGPLKDAQVFFVGKWFFYVPTLKA